MQIQNEDGANTRAKERRYERDYAKASQPIRKGDFFVSTQKKLPLQSLTLQTLLPSFTLLSIILMYICFLDISESPFLHLLMVIVRNDGIIHINIYHYSQVNYLRYSVQLSYLRISVTILGMVFLVGA